MATRLVIDGYGQLELNQVAFRRDGRIEAQCKLNEEDFKDAPAENGMLLAVDRVNREIKLPVDGSLPIALNYTTEHMYDERANSLKDFCLKPGEFYPRLGFLSQGELFTTNCVSGKTKAELEALTKKDLTDTPLYGGACATGEIELSATKPTYGPVLRVVEVTTMPDGTLGLKFQVQ